MAEYTVVGKDLGYFEAVRPTFTDSIFRVDRGPNKSLVFFGKMFAMPQPRVAIHPGLRLTADSIPPIGDPARTGRHDWFEDQNGQGSGSCLQQHIPTLRAEVERHEGLTMTSNSHWGIANSAFATDQPQQLIESLVASNDSLLIERALSTWDSYYSGSVRPKQQQFDSTDTDHVLNSAGCSFDFNPFDN
jgi:hypothetical protein